MRTGSVLIALWLIVGALAAGQRGDYGGPWGNCTKVGTILITIAAGPLNYVGLNPKLACSVPQPTGLGTVH
jgi:hypothetical protein